MFDSSDYQKTYVTYHSTLWDYLVKGGWFTVSVNDENIALMAKGG